MIKDKNAKFDDYSISPKIRQILLHWGYELVESDLFQLFVKNLTCFSQGSFSRKIKKRSFEKLFS